MRGKLRKICVCCSVVILLIGLLNGIDMIRSAGLLEMPDIVEFEGLNLTGLFKGIQVFSILYYMFFSLLWYSRPLVVIWAVYWIYVLLTVLREKKKSKRQEE